MVPTNAGTLNQGSLHEWVTNEGVLSSFEAGEAPQYAFVIGNTSVAVDSTAFLSGYMIDVP